MTFHETDLRCTLQIDELAARALQLDELKRRALTALPTPKGVAMTFAGELADRVEDFAAREAECCSFLNLATERREHDVRLEVSADSPRARRAIDLMFGLVRP